MKESLDVLLQQWKKRTKREQVLLIAFVFLLTTALVWTGAIRPARQRYDELKFQLSTLPSEDDVENLDEKLNEVETQLDEIYQLVPFTIAEGDGKDRLIAFQTQMRQDKALLLEEMNSVPNESEMEEFPYTYPFHMIYHIPPNQLMQTYRKRLESFPEFKTTHMSLVWGEDGWIRVDEDVDLMSELPLTQYAMTNFSSLGRPDQHEAVENHVAEKNEGDSQTVPMEMSAHPGDFVEEQTQSPAEAQAPVVKEESIDLGQLRYYVNHDASEVKVDNSCAGDVCYRLISRDIPGQLYINLPLITSDLNQSLIAEIKTDQPLKGTLLIGLVNQRGSAIRGEMERTGQTWVAEIPAGYQIRSLIYQLQEGEGEENHWIIEKISLQQ